MGRCVKIFSKVDTVTQSLVVALKDEISASNSDGSKQELLKSGDDLIVGTILNPVCHLASGLCKFIGHWCVPCTGRRPLTKVWA